MEGGARSTGGKAATATERQGDRRRDWHIRGFASTSGMWGRRAWGRGHWAEERARRLEAAPPRLDVPYSARPGTEAARRRHGETSRGERVDVRGEGCQGGTPGRVGRAREEAVAVESERATDVEPV